jgi:hypothetical protein
MRIERQTALPGRVILSASGLGFVASLFLALGCGGEPSRREVENARAFEALLTAVSLRNAKEFERDAKLIENRHGTGEISDGSYREIAEIIAKGRASDWAGAEKVAYAFRAQFGDRGSFFR